MTQQKNLNCDIFCAVVDNYGDIGVCWRLAKQLANEHEIATRLWVDDLASFRKLCPEVDPVLVSQQLYGVDICRWDINFPKAEPAQLVIEAFACDLPECYVAAMATKQHKPVWLNLEYLSAEDWVAGCHTLPSPHPRLPLIKYFFFPGFSQETGGLLLERDLLAMRDIFQADTVLQDNYWQALGVPARQTGELRVSLFSYENTAIADLLACWAAAEQPVTCLVPVGRALPQVAEYFNRPQLVAGDVEQQGKLRVQVLPFVEQGGYDELLWACDCNFVRGEDSFVRAQWAGKPFVWHIYPQHDGIHMKKLHAFLHLYCANLPADVAQTVHTLWDAWNQGPDGSRTAPTGAGGAWNDFWKHQSMLRQHAQDWSLKLSGNNLALNLLDFSRKVGKIAPFEI